jgi:histidinol-phosphate/aromatic aminotransferase/cobyric acid decarboxylase-like protein
VIGRTDLIDHVLDRGGWNFMPVTACAAATASLKDPQLIVDRRRINSSIRQQTFQWLDSKGYSYIPSQANFFLLDARRPGKDLRDAMAKENVMIGRSWPLMPTHARVTVGTAEEMAKFQAALQKVMKA